MGDVNIPITNDIKRINKTIEEGDKGFLLSFPKPKPGSVSPKDLYVFNFDVVYRAPLAEDLLEDEEAFTHRVIFTPSKFNNTEESSFTSSSIETNINIGISIKSFHRAETQTLVRLTIRDIYNSILYSDYFLIVCSPVKELNLNAEILRRGFGGGIGPRGGRVLRVRTDDSSASLLEQLSLRMQVEGPGIPTDQTIVIGSFLDDTRTEIELLPYFDILDDNFNPGGSDFIGRGSYKFKSVFSCASADDLRQISFSRRYIILDINNNWSYFFKQKLLAQFLPNTNNKNWRDIIVFLNIKNVEAIVGENQPSRVPFVSFIDATGRVSNESLCINSL